MNRCLGSDYSELTLTGEADSQTFAMGESTEVASDAAIFESDQDAQTALAGLTQSLASSEAEGCFTDLIEKNLEEEDVTLGEVDIGELSFTPPPVEEARAWQVAIPLEAEGVTGTVYLEWSVLREGDALAEVFTQEVDDPFDPSMRDGLLQVLADRMSG